MQKEKLIEEVKKYPFLYDLGDSKYNDTNKKDAAWKQISASLKQPETECKKIWLNLRESHRRALKKKKTKSGQAATTKKWTFEDEMKFLLPHYRERQTISSITDKGNFEDEDSDACSINDETLNTTKTSQNDLSNAEPESSVLSNIRPTSPASSVSNPPKPKKRAIETISASPTVMKYLIDGKYNKEDDEVDVFFKSIAVTVKKFSEYNQAVIKSKIYNAVSEMELKELSEKQNYYSYGNPYIQRPPYSVNRISPQPTTSSVETQDGVANRENADILNMKLEENED